MSNMFEGSNVMCENCSNKNEDCCKLLSDKISCFVMYLHESGFIYVPNGSTGLSIEESIYNILRHHSKDTKDTEGEDMNIPKPCEIVNGLISNYTNKQQGEQNG